MSTQPDDGGPAFPITGEAIAFHNGEPCLGMSMLDYFAGLAMQAHVSSYPNGEGCDYELIALDSYDQARAMLAARKRKEES